MLEGEGTIWRLGDGETIFNQGDSGREMYVVRSGKVRIFRSKDGKETTLTHLGPGDFFGEMALFAERPRSAYAQAVGETELQTIDKEIFQGLVGEDVVWSMLDKMSERIRQVDDKVEELCVQDQMLKDHLGTLSVRNQWFV